MSDAAPEDAPPAEDAPAPETEGGEEVPHSNDGNNGEDDGAVVGSAALRPVFLGNLMSDFTADAVTEIFTKPIKEGYDPIPVERVDMKRGYCFVFLKDAPSQDAKEKIQDFVEKDLNGMQIDGVSNAVRAEFARGDGRIKKKEDDRRKNMQPSETLFVVNFHEETTKREDLEMLFSPFGELVRVDMKRNYAFVQFKTIEEAKKAKETTNGGKLDQSVLTVEYVAQRRRDGGGRDGRRNNDRRGRDRYDDRRRGGYNDRRGGGYNDRRGGGGRDRYDDRGGGYNDRRGGGGGYGRDRSPYRGGGDRRSRSRSPPRGGGGGRYNDRYDRSRSRSPPRGGGSGGGGRYSNDRYEDNYNDSGRGGGRDDRGYRP